MTDPGKVLYRGFKALKQIVKLRYKLGQTEEMLAAYRWTSNP